MIYSNYQKKIFNAILNGNKNIAVNAVAGSGKTFTIEHACKMLNCNKHDVVFLAFNKSIASELNRRLSSYADVNTLHAFGLSVLKSIFNTNHRYIKVNNFKLTNYVKDNIFNLSSLITETTEMSKVWAFIYNCKTIFDLARVNLIKHGEKDKLQSLCDEHNIVTLFDEVNVCDILLADAYEMPRNLVIDYVDMLVLPLSYKDKIPTYKYVFIDECQDLNTAQRELMLCAARNGRFIAVGDRNQAINGFAGADCNSFDKIAKLDNTIELPLSVNYRCGSNIIRLAQELVPQITAHDGAIDGKISYVETLSKDMFQPNDMVICRTSAPLVGLCMKLLQNGITAIVKGKDIAQDLKLLVENANTSSIDEVLTYLAKEKNKLIAKIKHDRKCSEEDARSSQRYITFEDRCKCIENICMYSLKDTTELKEYISILFSDDNMTNSVVLSTIHKAKGLESDRVIILLPNKLPLTWKGQQEWQYNQEVNLKYVAFTRAKKELIIVNMEESVLADSNL